MCARARVRACVGVCVNTYMYMCKGLSCERSSGNLRWVCGDASSRIVYVAVPCRNQRLFIHITVFEALYH